MPDENQSIKQLSKSVVHRIDTAVTYITTVSQKASVDQKEFIKRQADTAKNDIVQILDQQDKYVLYKSKPEFLANGAFNTQYSG
jgi:hypothetical protein